jgi:CheY-like chemotaxis protein
LQSSVVVLDIGLPDLDGDQVAEAIRNASWGKATVLVAVTSRGREKDRKRAFAAGFDHHLAKPIRAKRSNPFFIPDHVSPGPRSRDADVQQPSLSGGGLRRLLQVLFEFALTVGREFIRVEVVLDAAHHLLAVNGSAQFADLLPAGTGEWMVLGILRFGLGGSRCGLLRCCLGLNVSRYGETGE